MSPITDQRTPVVASPRAKSLVLAIILLGQLMIILDASVVTTALPTIEKSLDFSPSSLTWVQNAYTLAFGGLLLLGARMGDILGRRRVFVAGIAVFTLASLAGGMAQSSEWLLIARAVQGMAAAVAAPSTLALLQQTFQEEKERARAVALFATVLSAGASLGLVVGGLLTQVASWRWSLFINVPIGVFLVAVAPRVLPDTLRQKGHFDIIGAITSTIGMSSVVYGFVRASSAGWSNAGTVAAFVIGAVLLVTFVFNEKRAEQPITPLHLFSSRERTGSHIARFLMVGGMFSMFFFVSQYTQGVLGFTPLEAGAAFLPQTLVMFALAKVIPSVVARYGMGRVVVGGIATATVGMIWLSQISADSTYWLDVALPLVIVGLGIGSAFMPMTALGIAGVDPKDAGAASGLVNASQQVGGSLGIGILVTVFESHSRGIADPTVALADGVSAVLTGSIVFLTLALVAITVAVRKQRKVEPVQEPVLEMAS